MGTHLGHSALYCLCQILQTYDFKKDVALIRGAVFHVGMALWGAQRVKTLDTYSAMTIMPTFQSALQCRHQLVLYEVYIFVSFLTIFSFYTIFRSSYKLSDLWPNIRQK